MFRWLALNPKLLLRFFLCFLSHEGQWMGWWYQLIISWQYSARLGRVNWGQRNIIWYRDLRNLLLHLIVITNSKLKNLTLVNFGVSKALMIAAPLYISPFLFIPFFLFLLPFSFFLSLYPCLSTLVALQTQVVKPQNTYHFISRWYVTGDEGSDHTHTPLCLP